MHLQNRQQTQDHQSSGVNYSTTKPRVLVLISTHMQGCYHGASNNECQTPWTTKNTGCPRASGDTLYCTSNKLDSGHCLRLWWNIGALLCCYRYRPWFQWSRFELTPFLAQCTRMTPELCATVPTSATVAGRSQAVLLSNVVASGHSNA